ncbi:MAG: 30S ribosome-binding factor RbfA [Kiritimatiellia bacterium]
MGIDRITRLNELLKRELAGALFSVMQNEDFDLAAATITRVFLGRDLREARVLVSIRDHQGRREHMLGLLRKHRPELQQMINKDLAIKYTPRLSFELDTSLEEGDRVLGILAKLEQNAEPAPGTGTPSGSQNNSPA